MLQIRGWREEGKKKKTPSLHRQLCSCLVLQKEEKNWILWQKEHGKRNTVTCFLPLFSLGSFMTDAAKRKARLPPPKSNINLRGRVHIRQEREGGIISKV